MKTGLLLFLWGSAVSLVAAPSDSTSVDSLKFSPHHHEAFRSYDSQTSWSQTNYIHAASGLLGRIGIVSTSGYTSQFSAPTYYYRNLLEPALQVVNGIPMNMFDGTLRDGSKDLMQYTNYISPLEIDQMTASKGGLMSQGYGHAAMNGFIGLSQAMNNPEGFQVSLHSGFTRAQTIAGSQHMDFYRNGALLKYGSDQLQSRLNAEYLKMNGDGAPAGFNIGLNTYYQPLTSLDVSLYLNHLQNKADDVLQSRRSMGHLGIAWQPLRDLKVVGGLSVVNKHVLRTLAINKWDANHLQIQYDVTAMLDKNITSYLGIRATAGLRNTTFEEKIDAASNGNTAGYLSNITRQNLFAKTAVDFKEMLFIGFGINREKSSNMPSDYEAVNYKILYGTFVFSKLLDNASPLSDGRVRFNRTYGMNQDVQSELGVDLGLFQNRYQLSVTYFNVQRSVTYYFPDVSSFGSPPNIVATNLLQTSDGLEIELNMQPTTFWDINLSWSNPVLKVEENNPTSVTSSTTSGGVTFGSIYFDPESAQLISFDPTPSWIATLSNDFNFGHWHAGALFSYRKGGDVVTFSFDNSPLGAPVYENIDGSNLALRNLYLRYRFQNLPYIKGLEIGCSAQNLWVRSHLPDNQLPENYQYQILGRAQYNQTFGFDLKIDL